MKLDRDDFKVRIPDIKHKSLAIYFLMYGQTYFSSDIEYFGMLINGCHVLFPKEKVASEILLVSHSIFLNNVTS